MQYDWSIRVMTRNSYMKNIEKSRSISLFVVIILLIVNAFKTFIIDVSNTFQCYKTSLGPLLLKEEQYDPTIIYIITVLQ